MAKLLKCAHPKQRHLRRPTARLHVDHTTHTYCPSAPSDSCNQSQLGFNQAKSQSHKSWPTEPVATNWDGMTSWASCYKIQLGLTQLDPVKSHDQLGLQPLATELQPGGMVGVVTN